MNFTSPKYSAETIQSAVKLSMRIGVPGVARLRGIPIGTISAWRRRLGVRYESYGDRTLAFLRESGTQPMAVIAAHLGIPRPQCVDLLRQLVRRGLVDADRTHKRYYRYFISTPADHP